MNLKLNFDSTKRTVVLKKVAVLLFLIISIVFSLTSCESEVQNRIVIWTSDSDLAQYVELYNQSHKTNKAIIVYKENPAKSLPPSKEEVSPDIVIGPWLQSDSVVKNFKSLDYLFDRGILTSSVFYPQLLEVGVSRESHILLPVSFNLPAMIYSASDDSKIKDNFVLSLDEIRSSAAEYNSLNRRNSYKKMGYIVSGNKDFLYLVSKIYGSDFHYEGNKIKWNEEKFGEAISNLSQWITTENRSIQTETDFEFKYLSMPDYRQVVSGYTLFAYTTSDQLFNILHNQEVGIDYRWIAADGILPVEDSLVSIGIYKRTRNQAGCTEFISWLFDQKNQDKILERKNSLNLNTEHFGFVGGFSSLINVTEHVLPKYYTRLLANLPPSQMLKAPSAVSPRWDEYKDFVLEPFIFESLKAYERIEALKKENEDQESDTPVLTKSVTIEDFEKEWRKKVFD